MHGAEPKTSSTVRWRTGVGAPEEHLTDVADSKNIAAWLDSGPSLIELKAAYPGEWESVQRDIADVVRQGDIEAVKAYVLELSKPRAPSRAQRRTKGVEDALLRRRVRQQMAAAAMKQMAVSAATGVTEGRVRFNLVNGWIAQKLLFESDLERKPVSLFWFRLVWPLLWQRKFLMPLVGPKGIYCFYSKQLISKLAERIGTRDCLEIAAGDGTLSRFLAQAGVRVTPTDDHSWRAVTFPEDVLRTDAREALQVHRPQVVLCSWPPAGNPFEQDVFKTDTVELYIVIASRHEFAAGNWDAYAQQSDFDFAVDPVLSSLVLPPELEAAVYLFDRKGAESSG